LRVPAQKVKKTLAKWNENGYDNCHGTEKPLCRACRAADYIDEKNILRRKHHGI
jgi:hypothetical protein